MLTSPVVILVGGPDTGKTRFFVQYTNSPYSHPTKKSTPNVNLWVGPSFVFVDTPGNPIYRNPQEYSWQGIFKYADVILDFGNWLEREIFGTKFSSSPKYMTWSGDDQETMKRLQEYLQEQND